MKKIKKSKEDEFVKQMNKELKELKEFDKILNKTKINEKSFNSIKNLIEENGNKLNVKAGNTRYKNVNTAEFKISNDEKPMRKDYLVKLGEKIGKIFKKMGKMEKLN
jgi:predicted patatin/cPLA2 family phospholipase